MKRIHTILIVVMVASLMFGAVAQAEKKKIKLGVLQWPTVIMQSEIVTNVLQERFGYEVTQVEFFEWAIAYSALARGDIDVLQSEINYIAHDHWTKYKDKLEKIGPFNFGIFQGLAVPTYVNIKSIDELNANRDLFNGKIIGSEAGSGLSRQTRQVIKAYNLDYELVDGSTAGLVASLKSAYDKKKPILLTLWTPFWPMTIYDVRFLEDPKNAQQPRQAVYHIARRGFTNEYPRASEVLRSIYIPHEERMLWGRWIKEGTDLKDVPRKWMERKKDLIDRWCVIGGAE